MYYGAHINSELEYDESNILHIIEEGKELGANCIQIFLRNPNNTKKTPSVKAVTIK